VRDLAWLGHAEQQPRLVRFLRCNRTELGPDGRNRTHAGCDLEPVAEILAETSAEDGGGAVEIGDRVQVQVGEDTRVRVITLAADRHDPDLGIISVRHPAGTALLGAQEDEEIEFEFDNKLRQWMVIKIEKGRVPASTAGNSP
jgi:hypothetical protein